MARPGAAYADMDADGYAALLDSRFATALQQRTRDSFFLSPYPKDTSGSFWGVVRGMVGCFSDTPNSYVSWCGPG